MAVAYNWYFEHLAGLTKGNRVYLLTDSLKAKQEYLSMLKGDEQKLNVITMEDFLVMNASRHPELMNYMGFAQQVDIEAEQAAKDMRGSEELYEDHCTFDEMQFGIREGKYFKGRFMTSRVNMDEATALVDGLKDDLLILGLKNQNRALNGDTVCIQVLPEKDWIANFKQSDIVNAIDKEEPGQAVSAADEEQGEEERDEDIPPSKEKITLMQKINSEKIRRVTAKVVGIIKPMNKTYGGSILSHSDQSAETRKKFEYFLRNMRIPLDQVDLYRVFVPFNV